MINKCIYFFTLFGVNENTHLLCLWFAQQFRTEVWQAIVDKDRYFLILEIHFLLLENDSLILKNISNIIQLFTFTEVNTMV